MCREAPLIDYDTPVARSCKRWQTETGMMNADLEAADDPEAMKQRFIAASPLARAYGRMISPEEVAQAVLYLASDASAMVTGTAVAIDGGKSLGVPPREMPK